MPHIKSSAQPASVQTHTTMAAVSLAAALCSTSALATPPVYRIVDLPGVAKVPTAQQSSVAQSINKNGDVAGFLVTYFPGAPTDQHKNTAAIWPADGSAPILFGNPQPVRPNDNVIARGVNNSHWMAGFSVDFYGRNPYPELWTSRRTPLALPTPGFGQALGINEAGFSVGFTQDTYADAPYVATIWAPDGTPQQIATGGPAVAINTSGAVLVNAGGPFIRDPMGGVRKLPDLPGQTQTGALYAYAMNDLNQAVGTCDLAGSDTKNQTACFWDTDGTVKDLGHFNDGNNQAQYVAWGINNGGQVLGYYVYIVDPNIPYSVPTLWTPQDGLMDLRTLVDPADPLYSWVGNLAMYAINDQGVIIGNNLVNGHGVKLVPNVPPPVQAP